MMARLFQCCLIVLGLALTALGDEKPDVLATDPSGTFRIERVGDEVWIVSTGDSTQRTKLPPLDASTPYSDEYHFSPNDEWVFGLRHVGSCLRDGDLYHRLNPARIDLFESFNTRAWENCVKLGALKRNYSDEGLCAMTFFVCWSIDSNRLLVELSGGEDKRDMQQGHLYFNPRTGTFELTDYLRKLNKAKSAPLACAEPADPLPPEAELRTRFETLDQRLNKAYNERIAQIERVSILRQSQREWIKHRDEGLKFYLASAPASERAQRRLQFLIDVTAARLEQLNRPAAEDL
jgi:uncharacterized protein YecT (DUF1311 family)